MKVSRYQQFKIRNRYYIDFINTKELIDFFDYNKYFKLKIHEDNFNLNNINDKLLKNDNDRFLLDIDNNGSVYFSINNKFTIENSRNIVLSYKNEKKLIFKLRELQSPSYKPKKIKRALI